MHGRVVTVQVQPQNMERAAAIYRDSVIPAAQQQKGFRGAMLFSDPTTGKGVSITLWDTEADLVAGQASGYYQEQIAKFATFLTSRPDQHGYELVVSAQVKV